jgi:hypothetical protein
MGKEKPHIYSEQLSEHESGVRSMVSEATGLRYLPLRSLEEAKSFSDGTVILEGDDGGQIYLVCPASMVSCSLSSLQNLLTDLDDIAWPGNDPNSASIFFERCATGSPKWVAWAAVFALKMFGFISFLLSSNSSRSSGL